MPRILHSQRCYYLRSWFYKNMKPEAAGLGNCSACCLRNLDTNKFCEKLCCVDDEYGMVYWTTKIPGHIGEMLMGLPPQKMVRWFNEISDDDIFKVSEVCIRRACISQK